MTNLGAAFELRRAMTAGERTIFDPVALVTRTERQHQQAIDRAAADATEAGNGEALAIAMGNKRNETRYRKQRDRACTEIRRLTILAEVR